MLNTELRSKLEKDVQQMESDLIYVEKHLNDATVPAAIKSKLVLFQELSTKYLNALKAFLATVDEIKKEQEACIPSYYRPGKS